MKQNETVFRENLAHKHPMALPHPCSPASLVSLVTFVDSTSQPAVLTPPQACGYIPVVTRGVLGKPSPPRQRKEHQPN